MADSGGGVGPDILGRPGPPALPHLRSVDDGKST